MKKRLIIGFYLGFYAGGLAFFLAIYQPFEARIVVLEKQNKKYCNALFTVLLETERDLNFELKNGVLLGCEY